MSLSWTQRKDKLAALLKSDGDDDADGVALDRLLHGQNVIGKTPKTVEIDALRFQDKDLTVVGTLEYGQFGVIDVVTCRLDAQTYVRKSTEKRFALRMRDQCFPQFERDILLQALKTQTRWAPHLLCAFQTPTHLNLVMDYAEGGSLWDVLESSPHNGRLLPMDLDWWIPQIVSAIDWCHTQGFAHRDIKPQNLVLKKGAQLLLIDFGSAAPLLPPKPDGTQHLPKRYCLLPCGTCDYISPEILKAHEAALVELEMEEDGERPSIRLKEEGMEGEDVGYGVETDWWSLGAMSYEMVYGFTPFFAKEIRHTYQKIMNHERSLRFDHSIPVPSVYRDFISKLLTHPERRIGRRSINEITHHPLFGDINWANLHERHPPEGLHLPQFTYNAQPVLHTESFAKSRFEESLSQGFAFSALFQSSPLTAGGSSSGARLVPPTPVKSAMQDDPSAAFIGFSWGPTRDAFPLSPPLVPRSPSPSAHLGTPQQPAKDTASYLLTPTTSSNHKNLLTTPRYNAFSTPLNQPPSFTPFRTNTIPRSTPRTAQRRELSDREAMKQLVDCVGMSARKRILESGRKPRILNNIPSLRSRSGNGMMRKELRFVGEPIPMLDYRSFSNASASTSALNISGNRDGSSLDASLPSSNRNPALTIVTHTASSDTPYPGSETDTEFTESEGPPSPSPRPTSALSMSLSRRSSSATPTTTMTMMLGGNSSSSMRSMSTSSLLTRRPSGSGSKSNLLGARSESQCSQVRRVSGGRKVSKGDEVLGGGRGSQSPFSQMSRDDGQSRNMDNGRITAGERAGMRSDELDTEFLQDDRAGAYRNPDPPKRPKAVSSLERERVDEVGNEGEGLVPDGRQYADDVEDEYDRLEERLDLLLIEIDDIGANLARVKLALRE